MGLNQNEAAVINELSARVYELSRVVKIHEQSIMALPAWLRKGIEINTYRLKKQLPQLPVSPQPAEWVSVDE